MPFQDMSLAIVLTGATLLPCWLTRNFIYRPQKFLTTLPSASFSSQGKWLMKAMQRLSLRGALSSAVAMPGALVSAAMSLPAAWAKGFLLIAKEFLLIGPAREMHCTAALCRRLDWVSHVWPVIHVLQLMLSLCLEPAWSLALHVALCCCSLLMFSFCT
jgi:hypothetical protein